jgi:2-oxo-4-hydroxy-4-carboxy-5-ureidoimidazoline decarboxylase
VTLAELNTLESASRAEAELWRCCASTKWSRLMAAARPFADLEAMTEAADRFWWSLDAADWLEAFAAHPRIGARAESAWSREEQARAATGPDDVREHLARANDAYQQRFGYTFLVCATGKTAKEILAILEIRLPNAPEIELRVAAEEQRKITNLRLRKLVAS